VKDEPNLYYLPLLKREDGLLSSQEIGHIHGGDLPLAAELNDYIAQHYQKVDGVVEVNGRLYKTYVYRPNQGDDYWYTLVDDRGTPVPSDDEATAPTGTDLKEFEAEIRRLGYSEALSPQESVSIPGSFIEPEFDETDGAGTNHRFVSWSALLEMPRVVIVGAPGAGKTTALRRLALHYFEQWEADTESPFPVYVQMRHLGEGGIIEQSFNNFLTSSGNRADEESNLPSLRNTRILLILDGLDEVGEHARDALVANVAKLADSNSIMSIIASTRESGYFWQFKSFRYLRIRPLTQAKVREWTFYRLGGSAEWLSFITSLEERQQLQELAGNPLLLSIATSLYRRNSTLPQNRSALLKSYFDALIEQWDSVRGIVRQREPWAAPSRKLSALGRAAYLVRVAGRESFTEDEFVAWNSSLDQSLELLYVCERETGTVRLERDGRWYFSHRMFSDYLAARYLVDDTDPIIAALERILKSGDWLDIWSLACGIAPDADDLVRSILNNRKLADDKKLIALAAAFEQDIVVSAKTFDDCAEFFGSWIEELFSSQRMVARKSRSRSGIKWSVRLKRAHSPKYARALLQSLQRLRKSRMADRIVALLGGAQEGKSNYLIDMLCTVGLVTVALEKDQSAVLTVTQTDELRTKVRGRKRN
jgi:hypothetical protein